MKLLVFLLCLAPLTCVAETYLCIAEASALVQDSADSAATAGLVDATKMKYLEVHQNGKWILKRFGHDDVFFNSCTSEFFCENSAGYTGNFIRLADGRFMLVYTTMLNNKDQMIVAKGRCSKV